jgi:hypothetical protein
MKIEAKLLRAKAINSLILSIDHFNRPYDTGRVEAVLILLDHAFEMLLKSAIIFRGGRIRQPRAKQTMGFGECVRVAFSDGSIRFLSEEDVLLLQTINSLRDAAQHHLINISEQHLYIQAQAGLTLFRRLLKDVFGKELLVELPSRVLPLSTTPPADLTQVFDTEVSEVRRLLRPGSRKTVEALAKLRSLAIMESSVNGEYLQPSQGELQKIGQNITQGKTWEQIFPGVASINITASGYGPSLDLKITKTSGVPITLVPEGTPGATVLAVKRVDDLGFYHLGHVQLAEKIGVSSNKATALIQYLKLQADSECYKKITIGGSVFNRYSPKAVSRMQQALKDVDVEQVWRAYLKQRKSRRIRHHGDVNVNVRR